jgi:hypothetical protein
MQPAPKGRRIMADTRTIPGLTAATPHPFHHVPGMAYRAAYTPETITAAALAYGDKRSAEYRAGLLDVLKFKLRGERIQCPYRAGTAQFDAYFAGNAHGFDVYRAHLAQLGGCHD